MTYDTVWGAYPPTDAELAAAMVVGAVVRWKKANDDDIPEGTAGEVVEVKDNGDRIVRFPAGRWRFDPKALVLATSEQVARWEAAKVKLDAQEAAHAATLVVGAVVTLTFATVDVPKGTAGEIIENFPDTNGKRVRFPAGTWNFSPTGLVLATSEQAARWETAKVEVEALALAHEEKMVVGAVVTWTQADQDIPEGTAGEVIEIRDEAHTTEGCNRRVRFPAGTWNFRPDTLALATPEQAAQWATAKAEVDAQLQQAFALAREMFAMFDVDVDGRLNKAEYKNYLQDIGFWAENEWTDEIFAGDVGWKRQCEDMECSVEEGISAEAFERILYGMHRTAKAQADFDSCKAASAAEPEPAP
eukprot:COSAG02_NODE_2425_length_8891_cov_48.519791_3_plen_359_part_00